jgi:hypothetical protein
MVLYQRYGPISQKQYKIMLSQLISLSTVQDTIAPLLCVCMLCHENVYESGGKSPRILNLDIRWRRVVGITQENIHILEDYGPLVCYTPVMGLTHAGISKA